MKTELFDYGWFGGDFVADRFCEGVMCLTPAYFGPLISGCRAIVTTGAAVALLALVLASDDALAASKARAKVSAAASAVASGAASGAAKEPEAMLGIISLRDQKISIYMGDTPVATSSISSGMEGHRTPKGVFSIIQKNRWHESNIYSGAEMPYMQRLTWSGIALHQGALPGYPASHGCIRLPGAFAEQLFSMSRMGARIIVSDAMVAPHTVVHGNLPMPVFRPAPGADDVATGGAKGGSETLIVSAANAAPIGTPTTALLNPIEFGRVARARSKDAAKDAEAEALDMQIIAKTAAELHREADADLVEAKAEVQQSQQLIVGLRRVVEGAAAGSEERAQAEASLWVAEDILAERQRNLESATLYERDMEDQAMAVAQSTKAALADRDQAEVDARTALRATEPVSVLISRKTRRVYVRQGFEPLLEASIDIAHEDQPIGTHVFTAVELESGGRTLKWRGVTVPDNSADGGNVTARAALDRVQIPVAVMEAVSLRAWVGASVMISDHAPSHETGKGTDFVLLTQ